jgi:hypothetical protein
MKRYFSFFIICLSILVITSCSSTQSDPSVKAVENYISALVNKDSASLSALSCADWESNAQMEFDSLQAVDTKLEGLKCSVIGTEGNLTQVNCKGKIIATYNNEDQVIDLSVRNYQVLHQGNDYLVCGYQ